MYRTIYLLFGVLVLACCGNGGDVCRWAADEETFILIRDGFDHTADPQEALPYFDKALQRDPQAVGAYYYRALTRYQLGDVEGALSDASEVIRLWPDAKEGYSLRARFYEDQGRLLACARDKLAHDRAPKTFEDYGREALDRHLTENPEDAKLYLSRARSKENRGDYEGAVKDYDEYLRLMGNKPRNDLVFWYKGIALEHLGDYQGAIESFETAMKVFPRDGNLRYLDDIAKLRRKMGDIEGAEADEGRYQEWILGMELVKIEKIYTEIERNEEEIRLIDRKLELGAGKGGLNEDARARETEIVNGKLKKMFGERYGAVADDFVAYRERVENARCSRYKSIYRKWLDLKEYDKAADAVEEYLAEYPDTRPKEAAWMREEVSQARKGHYRGMPNHWFELKEYDKAAAAIDEYLNEYPEEEDPAPWLKWKNEIEELREKEMLDNAPGVPRKNSIRGFSGDKTDQ